MKNRLLIIALVLVILGAFFSLGAYFYKKGKHVHLDVAGTGRDAPYVRDYSPSLGPVDAPITLVEFLDPECESCRYFYPIVKRIMNDYPEKIRLVIRYAPFHGNSRLAIGVLEASKIQGKYWETLELLFNYQSAWGDHHAPKPELIWLYLKELDLDVEKIRADSQGPEIVQIIEQDLKDLTELEVKATPTFFINGKMLKKFSEEGLREAIESEL